MAIREHINWENETFGHGTVIYETRLKAEYVIYRVGERSWQAFHKKNKEYRLWTEPKTTDEVREKFILGSIRHCISFSD